MIRPCFLFFFLGLALSGETEEGVSIVFFTTGVSLENQESGEENRFVLSAYNAIVKELANRKLSDPYYLNVFIHFVVFTESSYTKQVLSTEFPWLTVSSDFVWDFCYKRNRQECEKRGILWNSMWETTMKLFPEFSVISYLNGDILFDWDLIRSIIWVHRHFSHSSIEDPKAGKFIMGGTRVDVTINYDKITNFEDAAHITRELTGQSHSTKKYLDGGVDIFILSRELVNKIMPIPMFVIPLVCADNYLIRFSYHYAHVIDTKKAATIWHIDHGGHVPYDDLHEYNCRVREQAKRSANFSRSTGHVPMTFNSAEEKLHREDDQFSIQVHSSIMATVKMKRRSRRKRI
eukprot:CAMPEP_0174271506 /NCGR_PEP_ID=MMETSP0439-20130205/48109_1 /TAXON_ID=0 /ORGANISM="Stereomyxa ramosa, Strain Chinc5" /LENGTH=346 /DNA_ID=CAMNT_0015361551 /DNA_START=66 /DNA_END=1106 /DNA_ORIENTATION=+